MWIVVILGVCGVIREALSLVTPSSEYVRAYNAAVRITRILLWAAAVIAVIIVALALLACMVSP